MTKQPRCRSCGKPIPKDTRRQWLRTKADVDRNPHINNGDIVVDQLPQTIAECQKLTNRQVTHVWRDTPSRVGIYSFSDWDGESYRDKFFCTNTCAIRLGHAAARKGLILTPYSEAVAKEDA